LMTETRLERYEKEPIGRSPPSPSPFSGSTPFEF
jgi:hypothetical protein